MRCVISIGLEGKSILHFPHENLGLSIVLSGEYLVTSSDSQKLYEWGALAPLLYPYPNYVIQSVSWIDAMWYLSFSF